MPSAPLLADMIKRSKERTGQLLADFTDEQMLHRPVKGANHAMWQMGHVAQSTWRMMATCDPSVQAPEDARFTKEAAIVDDPAKFPKKQEVLEQFGKAMDAATTWVSKLSDDDLAKPSPERIKGFAPTIGHLASLLSHHATSHAGQYSVIRRALGKPVLF